LRGEDLASLKQGAGLKKGVWIAYPLTTTTDPGVCTYTFNDGAIALSFPDGSSSTNGSISGSTLSVTLGGTVFIFQK